MQLPVLLETVQYEVIQYCWTHPQSLCWVPASFNSGPRFHWTLPHVRRKRFYSKNLKNEERPAFEICKLHPQYLKVCVKFAQKEIFLNQTEMNVSLICVEFIDQNIFYLPRFELCTLVQVGIDFFAIHSELLQSYLFNTESSLSECVYRVKQMDVMDTLQSGHVQFLNGEFELKGDAFKNNNVVAINSPQTDEEGDIKVAERVESVQEDQESVTRGIEIKVDFQTIVQKIGLVFFQKYEVCSFVFIVVLSMIWFL